MRQVLSKKTKNKIRLIPVGTEEAHIWTCMSNNKMLSVRDFINYSYNYFIS